MCTEERGELREIMKGEKVIGKKIYPFSELYPDLMGLLHEEEQ